jgi:hypothetical protein
VGTNSGGTGWLFAAAALATAALAPAAAQASVLYDQFAPSATGRVSSQNFEPDTDAYDDLGADDFVVPAGKVWRINDLEVGGDRSGTDEAASANVFLFADAGALPGVPITTLSSVARGSGLAYPDLDLPLSGMPVLTAGRYWIGVQANLVFSPGASNWFWRDRTPQFGQPAAWRQPGDGFGGGCTSFVARLACPSYAGSGATPDQAFRLNGEAASPRLKVLKAKAKHRGRVVIRVTAPDLGSLVARSSKLKTVRRKLTGIGRAKLVMSPRSGALAKLRTGGKVRAKLRLTLSREAGPNLAARAKLMLKR